MSMLKILKDVCAIREIIGINNAFAGIAYNVSVVKDFW